MYVTGQTLNNPNGLSKYQQNFFARGKILLSGEYFVLDGALALAVPTTVGQELNVKYSKSYDPVLTWKSLDYQGNPWFEAKFEFWHFDLVETPESPEAVFLQNILRSARKQNSHFLRDEVNVEVETKLQFPLDWGLGSSSTLIHNIAQWAYVSPFELLFKTTQGSGYDIACAQSDGPILYERKGGPNWSPIVFNPVFQDNIYFIYLGRKRDTKAAIEEYFEKNRKDPQVISEITEITKQITTSTSLEEFERLIFKHEKLVESTLGLSRVKTTHFSDYWGEVKSLGAWGGDFVLVTSDRSAKETIDYFKTKGHSTLLPYRELILNSDKGHFQTHDNDKLH